MYVSTDLIWLAVALPLAGFLVNGALALWRPNAKTAVSVVGSGVLLGAFAVVALIFRSYAAAGLAGLYRALAPGGTLVVWSVSDEICLRFRQALRSRRLRFQRNRYAIQSSGKELPNGGAALNNKAFGSLPGPRNHLATLLSKTEFDVSGRKNLRRERQRVIEQGLELRTLTGNEIGTREWEQFYRFYQMTYAKRSGHGGYLTREFFTQTAAAMGDQVVMVMAYQGDSPVAGALYFRSSDTLFGRYWGCEREFDCLHFEACYYQGIEYCIAQGLQRFDPGAQGEHKIQRGFHPVHTYSNHWIADGQLSAAVGDFTRREIAHVEAYKEQAATLLPFKQPL